MTVTIGSRVIGGGRPAYVIAEIGLNHNGDVELAKRLIDVPLALPAYEATLKAAHTFNMLDARGAISVTERAAYIGRIRNLSRAVAQAYFDSREKLGFPMLDSCNRTEASQ